MSMYLYLSVNIYIYVMSCAVCYLSELGGEERQSKARGCRGQPEHQGKNVGQGTRRTRGRAVREQAGGRAAYICVGGRGRSAETGRSR